MALTVDDLINIYDVLASDLDDETGSISYQLGDAINKRTITTNAENWQYIGFCSRPANVLDNPTDAPQCLSIAKSDQDLVFASRDVRGQKLYKKIQPGETCLYASGTTGAGTALMYMKNDSSINLYTISNDGEADRAGMVIALKPSDDSINIFNSRGYGIRIDKNGVAIVGKDGNSVVVGSELNVGSLKVGNLEAMNCTVSGGFNMSGPKAIATITCPTTITGATSIFGIIKLVGTATLGPSSLAAVANVPPPVPSPYLIPGALGAASGILSFV